MRRLTFEDIPVEFQYQSDRVPPSGSFIRFTHAVAEELGILSDPAGLHLLQASWQLKFGLVALGLRNNAVPLPNAIGEDPQFVTLAAFQLALVSCSAVLDLGAASLVGMAGGDLTRRAPDLREVAERRSRHLPELPVAHSGWIEETYEMSRELLTVRDAVVHRHVPVSVTVGARHSYGVGGLDVHPSIDEFVALAIDRHMTLLFLIRREQQSA